MKTKILAILIGICIFYNAHSQSLEGKWFIGGSVSYSYWKKTQDSYIDLYNRTTSGWTINKDFTISPRIGYFLDENLLISIQTGFDYDNYNYLRVIDTVNSGSNSTSLTFSEAVCIQNYFGKSEKFKWFTVENIQVGREYARTKYYGASAAPTDTAITYTTSFIFQLGITYFIHQTIGIEARMNILSTDFSYYEATKTSLFSFQGSNNISFGLSYYFGGRKSPKITN